jgi:RNA polymerase subunit RPABC4/transcription elongation factor Spt4
MEVEPSLCRGNSGKHLIGARDRLEAAWYPDCMICLSEKRHTRFDCGHLVACKECAEALLGQRSTCPVCRRPIGMTVFDGMMPVVGRQPTFESKEIGLQRLVAALTGVDAAACEEAEMVVCQKAVEETAQVFVDAGVIPPLVQLLGTQGASLGRQAACCALGILAASGAHQEVIDAGGVPALLQLLASEGAKGTPSLEYAALALGALTEHSGSATAAAVRSSAEHRNDEGGGLAPLVKLVLTTDTAAARVDGEAGSAMAAVCAALVCLSDLAAVNAVTRAEVLAAATQGQFRTRLRQLECSGDEETVAAAATLREMMAPKEEEARPGDHGARPEAEEQKRKVVPRHTAKPPHKNCVVQ